MDIVQHFIVGFFLQLFFNRLVKLDQITSTGLVLSIAISKEVWDKLSYGSPAGESFKDIIMTMFGNIVGVII